MARRFFANWTTLPATISSADGASAPLRWERRGECVSIGTEWVDAAVRSDVSIASPVDRPCFCRGSRANNTNTRQIAAAHHIQCWRVRERPGAPACVGSVFSISIRLNRHLGRGICMADSLSAGGVYLLPAHNLIPSAPRFSAICFWRSARW